MNPVRGFWQNIIDEKIHKGETISVVAPMADVTDIAFRTMIAKYSKPCGPDVMWTEFVSANGLSSKGREVLKRDLEFGDIERPIVAQLFTADPDTMRESAKLCKELGFDGIDINMGCPDKSIEKQGAGAAHMKDWRNAQKVIRAAQEGAGDMPVSVKTRIGFNTVEFMEWLPKILECNIPVLTVHLRTRKEMSKVPAHWELMPEIVNLVRGMTGELSEGGTILIGNGDVLSVKDGKEKAKKTGCDGVMIGRGIFGTPWFFNQDVFEKGKTIEEKLTILVEHTKLFEEKLCDIKSFAIMKKHYKAYINGFDGAHVLRSELMECENAKEVEEKIHIFLQKNNS
ncbi:MAG: tRNA-dihydrouridine synthase [Candidatus Pacebacteria bacterium]|nr:tRNA-dihydrouridine synthase [Candidatus Paceibacterota bacterium]MBP9866580.1 tRNA-dihydrouridine synthase [Candidatus Paceibacterota bacterium]